MKYDERAVDTLYRDNLRAAADLLAPLQVLQGRPVSQGNRGNPPLSGWISEQTIRYCLCEELALLGLAPQVREQVTLFGRARIDLLIATTALEVKTLGSFGRDEKYAAYRSKVEERGWAYCYVSGSETHPPYRAATESVFGKERTFYLDTPGTWHRLVQEVVRSVA